MIRYVQHKSGIGETWEVIPEDHNEVAYRVRGKQRAIHPALVHYLPKSEYVEVPAPERWVDVTADCNVGADALCAWHNDNCVLTVLSGYRLRKVQHGNCGWAFIVERREP